jgi:hypothetical protein
MRRVNAAYGCNRVAVCDGAEYNVPGLHEFGGGYTRGTESVISDVGVIVRIR